ncbi:hypothetical protein QBC33DRAFT_556294 [Phialemonium atrogriseum]|uniref:Uncharacterized protein n=1 Tax=Phialemonium atrogriseum TaxID=1093897 RepID=A0AAJ0FIR9_9PEZI|nr:uncharacterized protein QBC33DRAFT_556294 [Phialemonium atrogriseum]KAK1769871.1 hypothetical protein QBC33DRAFT_556294 [Phialemonium atrogriseum]
MAGHFSDGDIARCEYYARFAAHLGRTSFDVIYWLLFLLVIIMLFAASWRYGRSVESVSQSPAGSADAAREMKRCMLACGLYAGVSVAAVVTEVFALLALQFCDGEDLMPLYWAAWTALQVGALIAILGILLAASHTVRGGEHPPWALALGTPVLVVAGLGHVVQAAMLKRIRGARRWSPCGRGARSEDNLAMSREDTIRVEGSVTGEAAGGYDAHLVGYTADGGPIIEFGNDGGVPVRVDQSGGDGGGGGGPDGGGRVVVAFSKGMATVVRGGQGHQEKGPGERAARPGSTTRPLEG